MCSGSVRQAACVCGELGTRSRGGRRREAAGVSDGAMRAAASASRAGLAVGSTVGPINMHLARTGGLHRATRPVAPANSRAVRYVDLMPGAPPVQTQLPARGTR